MYLFQGASALSPFRIQRLYDEIKHDLPQLTSLGAEVVFIAWFNGPATPAELRCLENLTGATWRDVLEIDRTKASAFVTSRIGTISPWSSKATEIGASCGLKSLVRLERITY